MVSASLFTCYWKNYSSRCLSLLILMVAGERRVQFAFMSLQPLLYENLSCQARWATITMVETLMEGEATYLKAFEQQTMLDAQTLTYLSDRVVSKH